MPESPRIVPTVISLVLAMSMVYVLFRIKKMEASVTQLQQHQAVQLSVDDVQRLMQDDPNHVLSQSPNTEEDACSAHSAADDTTDGTPAEEEDNTPAAPAEVEDNTPAAPAEVEDTPAAPAEVEDTASRVFQVPAGAPPVITAETTAAQTVAVN